MGLIAELQRENAELKKRVKHLEAAFEGLRQYTVKMMDEWNRNEGGIEPKTWGEVAKRLSPTGGESA